MSIPFHVYPKIAERVDHWGAAPNELRRLDRQRWAVTEKIHGANVCLVIDADAVRVGKRRALLGDDEPFFNVHEVRARVTPAARALFASIRAEAPALRHLLVYGELFGGAYPHPEVAPVAGVQPIQTGIHYCPGIEFSAFDLARVSAGEGLEGAPVFYGWGEALERLRAHGILASEPLHVGTLRDALDFPLGFDSTLPRRLGLPPLAGPNPAEGVVIRPLTELLVGPEGARRRPLLKRKIAVFAEDRRFHGASAWSAQGSTTSPLERLTAAALAMINDPRLDSARSKLGPLATGDLDALAELDTAIREDVWEQLGLDEAAALARLDDAGRELLEATIRDAVAALILGRFT
ncbi:MAG: RNA ligase family protein [Nannocystaceae bacterium]